MKIWTITLNTLNGLIRNKILIVFCLLFVAIVLLMLSPLLAVKTLKRAGELKEAQSFLLTLLTFVVSLASGFGSLVAIGAAAGAIATEIRTGTILAIMARPIARWEFLLGKYLGVQILLLIYIFLMLILDYALAWFAGERIASSGWVFLAYPLVRYALYSALALLFSTFLHPYVAGGVTLLVLVLVEILPPKTSLLIFLPRWALASLYYVLPSTDLLFEGKFLTLTRAALAPTPGSHHWIALAYGLDYALILLLLAAWVFRKRNLISH